MTTVKESDYRAIVGEGFGDYEHRSQRKSHIVYKRVGRKGDYPELGVGFNHHKKTLAQLARLSEGIVTDESVDPLVSFSRCLAQS